AAGASTGISESRRWLPGRRENLLDQIHSLIRCSSRALLATPDLRNCGRARIRSETRPAWVWLTGGILRRSRIHERLPWILLKRIVRLSRLPRKSRRNGRWRRIAGLHGLRILTRLSRVGRLSWIQGLWWIRRLSWIHRLPWNRRLLRLG